MADNAALTYEEALSAFNKGEIQTAKIHVKNALLEDPTLIFAHILLGKIHLRENDGALAEKELLIAERLGADPGLTQEHLGEAYLIQKKYQVVLDSLFPTLKNPRLDAAIFVKRAKAHAALNQLDEALRAYDQAIKAYPEGAAAAIGKARALVGMRRFDQAEAEITAALAADASLAEAWYVKGSIHHANGDLVAALNAYKKAASRDAGFLDAQTAFVGILMDQGRYAEALTALAKFRDAHPDDPRLLYFSALARIHTGDPEGGRADLVNADDILTQLPKQMLDTHGPTTLLAGLVRFELGQNELALDHLSNFLRREPGHPGASLIAGSILLAKGEHRKAVDYLEPALQQSPTDIRIMSLLGQAYSQDKKYVRASDMLDKAVRLSGGDLKIRTQRAYNNIAGGKVDTAMLELADIFRQAPGHAKIGTTLYLHYMKNNRYAEAVAVARQLVDIKPEEPTFLNFLATAQALAKDLEGAKESYDEVLVRTPGFFPAQINLGKLILQIDGPQPAAEYFDALLRGRPDNPRLLLELARAYKAANQLNKAAALLEKLRAKHPEQLEAYITLAEIYLQLGDPKRALAVMEAAETQAPADFRVLYTMARVNLALDRRTTAQNLSRRLSAEAGYDTKRLFAIADLQLQAEDLRGAIWSYTKAVESDPNNLGARVRLVHLLIRNGKPENALKQAQEVSSLFADRPTGELLLGDIKATQGLYQEALEHYTNAAKIDATTEATLGIFNSRLALGQLDAAYDVLKQAQIRSPDDLRIRLAMAELHLRRDEWAAAKVDYEYLLSRTPDNASVLNNLAYIYHGEGDIRAIDLARKAVEAAPQSASAKDTLGWILVQNDQAQEGLKHLRNASALFPDNPTIRYHLAVALKALGRNTEAVHELDSALAGNAKQPWSSDARSLREALK